MSDQQSIQQLERQIDALREHMTRSSIECEVNSRNYKSAEHKADFFAIVSSKISSDGTGPDGETIAEIIEREYSSRPHLAPAPKLPDSIQTEPAAPRPVQLEDITAGTLMSKGERARIEGAIFSALQGDRTELAQSSRAQI